MSRPIETIIKDMDARAREVATENDQGHFKTRMQSAHSKAASKLLKSATGQDYAKLGDLKTATEYANEVAKSYINSLKPAEGEQGSLHNHFSAFYRGFTEEEIKRILKPLGDSYKLDDMRNAISKGIDDKLHPLRETHVRGFLQQGDEEPIAAYVGVERAALKDPAKHLLAHHYKPKEHKAA